MCVGSNLLQNSPFERKETPTRTSLTEMTENGYYEDFVIGTILTRSAEKMAVPGFVTQTLAHGMNYHV